MSSSKIPLDPPRARSILGWDATTSMATMIGGRAWSRHLRGCTMRISQDIGVSVRSSYACCTRFVICLTQGCVSDPCGLWRIVLGWHRSEMIVKWTEQKFVELMMIVCMHWFLTFDLLAHWRTQSKRRSVCNEICIAWFVENRRRYTGNKSFTRSAKLFRCVRS